MAGGEADKDGSQNAGRDQGNPHALNGDGILNLTKGRLLDPEFLLKYLAKEEPVLIPFNPRLVRVSVESPLINSGNAHLSLVAVSCGTVVAVLAALGLLEVFVVIPEFPRPHVVMMKTMQNNTHPVNSRVEC